MCVLITLTTGIHLKGLQLIFWETLIISTANLSGKYCVFLLHYINWTADVTCDCVDSYFTIDIYKVIEVKHDTEM